MCFSFSASVAALLTGVLSAALVLYYLIDRVDEPYVRHAGVVLPAMLVSPAIVQACDAAVHAKRNGWLAKDFDLRLVALVCWLVIVAQPLAVAVGTALLLDGAASTAMALVATFVIVHVLFTVSFDGPFSRWLWFAVVEKEGWPASVVHGFFFGDYGHWWAHGPSARRTVYAVSYVASFVGVVLLSERVRDRKATEPLAERVANYMLVVSSFATALYVLSQAFVHYVSRVRGHVSSVWCAVSLVGTVGAGVYLTAAEPFGVAYLAACTLCWIVTYAVLEWTVGV